MENKVFEIQEFSMIGRTLFTYLEREDLKFDEKRKVFVDGDNTIQKPNHLFLLTTSLTQFNEEDIFSADTELLPYKAKVIQDLTSSVSKYIEPEEYPNCQLMSEKHGGYLQFKNLDNGEVLRIAINSNYYVLDK